MKILLLLSLFTSILFGTNIATVDVIKDRGSVSLMLSFDSPYQGKIQKDTQDDHTLLELDNMFIDETFIEDEISSFLKNITIKSHNERVLIIVQNSKDARLIVSKSKDAMQLRIKWINKNLIEEQPKVHIDQVKKQPNNANFSLSDYLLVLLFSLAASAIVLLLFSSRDSKNKLSSEKEEESKSIEAVEEDSTEYETEEKIEEKVEHSTVEEEHMVSIRYESSIDEHNRAVLLTFNDKEYLVVIGKKNKFLDVSDSFPSPISSETFDDITKELRLNNEQQAKMVLAFTEPLQSYKEKASRE